MSPRGTTVQLNKMKYSDSFNKIKFHILSPISETTLFHQTHIHLKNLGLALQILFITPMMTNMGSGRSGTQKTAASIPITGRLELKESPDLCWLSLKMWYES